MVPESCLTQPLESLCICFPHARFWLREESRIEVRKPGGRGKHLTVFESGYRIILEGQKVF